MQKNTHYVITVTENGKKYSFAETVNNSTNLVGNFPKNAVSINACDTKRESEEMARWWNECYRKNGIFDVVNIQYGGF